jgi:L-rhamnose isomerase
VWDELCQRDVVPAGADWLKDVARYERTVMSKRG